MSGRDTTALGGEMIALGRAARLAAAVMRQTQADVKSAALFAAAGVIRDHRDLILSANAKDVKAARALDLSPPLLDRLTLDAARVEAMAHGVEIVAALPDPVGRELARWTVPSGLDIARVATPIGVIAMIYESRPNVTADAGALAIKSGNVAILRGGSESVHTSSAIHAAMIEGLRASDLPEAALSYVTTTDREAVGLMLEGLNGTIDLIIPRGGKGLTTRVLTEARVPVLAHLEGVCHVYLHAKADAAKALAIVLNAKMRRVSVCGSAETLLIDRAILPTLGKGVLTALAAANCEIRGDDEILTAFAKAVPARDEDWSREYLDAIIAVKTVDGIEQAIAHIEKYGSHHTEAIVTEDRSAAERFLSALDSAIVMWNASTQFADGAEFGMGAEIGIGTGKLHARGPVGVEQLTTFKYIVRGNGQIRP